MERQSLTSEVLGRLERGGRTLRKLCLAALLPTLAAGCAHVAPRADDRTEVVQAISQHLVDEYVYESTGRVMADSLRAALRGGVFRGLDDQAFARRVTQLLFRISNDRHLGVDYVGDPTATTQVVADSQPAAAQQASADEDMREYGFGKVGILNGGVGYIELTGFSAAPRALEYADSVLASFADVKALIIDVRQNTGGGPELIRLISTYLFEERTHLVSTFIRGMPTPMERWTLDAVKGKRLSATPVYVLTSRATISAPESFVFGLKARNRVTLVGERTAGGGHFGHFVSLPGGFAIFVPRGRTYDPVTNLGWEAEGIAPDIEVPAIDALNVALRQIAATKKDR